MFTSTNSSLLESPNLLTTEVEVSKNRNHFMKILFLPICNEIIVRISLEIGRNDVLIKSFWFLLTFIKYFFFLCFFLEVSLYRSFSEAHLLPKSDISIGWVSFWTKVGFTIITVHKKVSFNQMLLFFLHWNTRRFFFL